jgi:hypothetical protein
MPYKTLTGVMTRANTPPAPFGNKATPPVPEPPPIPGTRRFLLAVETNVKDPAHAAEFNAWCNDVHIPDDLSCPGYRAVVLLDRVAGGGAPGRAQNLTFFEVHTDDCAKVVAMRDERRLRELVLGAYNGGGMYVGPWAQAYYEPMGEVMVRA